MRPRLHDSGMTHNPSYMDSPKSRNLINNSGSFEVGQTLEFACEYTRGFPVFLHPKNERVHGV